MKKQSDPLILCLLIVCAAGTVRSAPSPLEQQLAHVTVAKIELSDTSVNSALDYLVELTAKESGGKAALNIVRMFPKDYGDNKHISLTLQSMPVSEVLRYLAMLADLRVEYAGNAVKLIGKQPATPQP